MASRKKKSNQSSNDVIPPTSTYTPPSTKEEFQMSRLTIRVKLMALIFGLIGISLFVMIQLVTYFYTDDMAANVQETNLKLANVIGTNVETIITALSQNARIVSDAMLAGNESRAAARAFQTDPNLIMVSVLNRAMQSQAQILNRELMKSSSIAVNRVQSIPAKYKDNFSTSFSGKANLINASPGFKIPLLALAVPFGGENSDKIIVMVFKMQSILAAFQSPGLAEVYMVSNQGVVVAHPNKDITLAGKNNSDQAIVKHMISSKFNSGQIRYEQTNDYYLGSFKKIPVLSLGVIATVNENQAFAGVYRIQRRNIYLMIVVISLAVLVAFLFARQLVGPIRKLTLAARQISRGVYHVRMQPEHRDEIGMLTNNFNQMAQGLEERENLKESFGRFVNKELAEMSMSGNLGLGGERKEVAIFFSDIRGFTAMSESLRPEDVVDVLNDYFTRMVKCVNDTEGLVDKFIGDAIMAHWGALRVLQNNTEAAINAALLMREQLLDFNNSRGRGMPELQMGMGINTGPVIAGQIGSNERLEYTVIGDAVNLASRVEALTKHFGVDILVTDHALAEVKGIFKAQKMDAIKVKGKARPVTVYAILGREDDNSSPASLSALRKRLGIKYTASKKSANDFKDAKYESA